MTKKKNQNPFRQGGHAIFKDFLYDVLEVLDDYCLIRPSGMDATWRADWLHYRFLETTTHLVGGDTHEERPEGDPGTGLE